MHRTVGRIGAVIIGTALVAGLGFVAAPASATGSQVAEASSELPPGAPAVAHITTLFDHPISLFDAATVTNVGGNPVVAYRFQSGDLVGEYAREGTEADPAGTLSPQEFLNEFVEQYGTEPQVIGVITLGNLADVSGTSAKRQSNVIDTEFPEYTAPLATSGKAVDLVKSQQPAGARNDDDASRLATTWIPDQAQIEIVQTNTNTVNVMGYYAWVNTDPYNTPSVLNPDFGLEMQVDVYTDAAGYQTGKRPGTCANSDYKYRPSIANVNYTWTMYMSGADGGLTPVTAMQGAYADYNDALDSCNRNSIALGLGNPQDLAEDNSTFVQVQTNIWAPKGLDAKSRIAATVQAVDRGWCMANPAMTFTDCMGVLMLAYPGPGPAERVTLGAARNWIAPDKCWFSDHFGTDPNSPPQSYC